MDRAAFAAAVATPAGGLRPAAAPPSTRSSSHTEPEGEPAAHSLERGPTAGPAGGEVLVASARNHRPHRRASATPAPNLQGLSAIYRDTPEGAVTARDTAPNARGAGSGGPGVAPPPVGPPTPQEDALAAPASEASSRIASDSASGPHGTESPGSPFSQASDSSTLPAPCNLEMTWLRTGPRRGLWIPQLDGLTPTSWEAMVPMTRAQFEEL